MKERILRPSNKRTILLALGSLIFVASGFLTIKDGDTTGWMATVFFGMCLVVFIIKMLPNSTYLKLMPHGFELCTLFRKQSYNWEDVSNFAVIDAGKTMVGFNFTPGYKGKEIKALRTVNSVMAGREGALPDLYGMKPNDLVELMEHWRAQALVHGGVR